VNEIRAERMARVANPLALVAQQQPVYHPPNHSTHYTQNSSTRSQQAATRNRGKAIVNSPQPIYDQEPSMVAEEDESSKDKKIDKLMALISLSFKKIYKPTNNNLRTSSNTSRANQDNSPRVNRNAGYENQRFGNVAGARETVGSTMVQKSGIQYYNCKEFGHIARECQKAKRANDAAYHREKMLLYQELEAHYIYMAQLQEVAPDVVDSGPIFDTEPVQKVSNDDHYNVFAIESAHPEQSESVHDTYPIEQDAHDVIIDSLDMSNDSVEIDQNDDDVDLAKERELLASLIEKLKCEINESKIRNKLLETSNKVLVEKLKSEIEVFKNKNKSLESSNNFFKEANNKLSEINDFLYADYKKSQAELARRNTKEYASQMELECAKKEAQIKLYKTREDKEIKKVIELENKVKVLDNIVYKTGQSVQTINMLNNKCRTSFAKPEFLKKAKTANPRLPYDYTKLNNLYDLFVPQREKSSEQRFFAERSRMSHINVQNEKKKESFQKRTTLLEKRMDESIPLVKNCQSSLEIVNIKMNINTIITGDLKAQLQDKGIAISELKKLIEKLKGKYVDTKFEKSSVIRQPNAFKIQRPLVLGKPTTFSNSFIRKDFSKSTSVTQTHVSNDFSKPVTTQTLPPNKNLNAKTLNVKYVCATCDTCVLNDKHDMCVLESVAKPIKKTGASESNMKPRNLTRKLYERVSKTCSWWYPKFTPSGYIWKPKSGNENVNQNLVEIVLFIVDSRCLKHMTGNLKLLINFVEKFLGTVKFGNDQIAPILGFGDLVQGAVTIKRVYYVKGLTHNLFFVGQFCDADLEVAFRKKSTCFIRDLKGNDLLTGSRGIDLYSIILQDTNFPNPICLMAKATSSQAWLWHRRLSHLNFDTINLLSKNDIVVGLPKLKFVKDHLCSSWILHQTSVARTPEQNGVVKRRNRTLVEATRIMLSAAKVPLFFWAEAIATACFTQNCSLVIPRHKKTPYHIINDQKLSVKFFYIFGSICYIVRDGENLDKIKEKGNECIFVGYSTLSRAYRVFNKRT
nr:integrase, catalytic region, zinc finger, CCHC-type, peptidase aspartic, catalytic [Tanacetum cinerariifolium]